MTDQFGNELSVGDRIVFCYRGWLGKDADLQMGTVTRITEHGVWCKPDNSRFGRRYDRYNYKTKSYEPPKNAPTQGWKWSTRNLVVKMGS